MRWGRVDRIIAAEWNFLEQYGFATETSRWAVTELDCQTITEAIWSNTIRPDWRSDQSLVESKFLERLKVANLPSQVIGVTTMADEMLHAWLIIRYSATLERITLYGNSFPSCLLWKYRELANRSRPKWQICSYSHHLRLKRLPRKREY